MRSWCGCSVWLAGVVILTGGSAIGQVAVMPTGGTTAGQVLERPKPAERAVPVVIEVLGVGLLGPPLADCAFWSSESAWVLDGPSALDEFEIPDLSGPGLDTTNGGCTVNPPLFQRYEAFALPVRGLSAWNGTRVDIDETIIHLDADEQYFFDYEANFNYVAGLLAIDSGGGPEPQIIIGNDFAEFCGRGSFVITPFTVSAACTPSTISFTPTQSGDYVHIIRPDTNQPPFAEGSYFWRVRTCVTPGEAFEDPVNGFELADLGNCDLPGWDPLNGGCFDPATHPFVPLVPGTALSGASAYDAVLECQDTDWFTIYIPYAGDWNLQLTSDFPATYGVVNGQSGPLFTSGENFCPATGFAAATLTEPCVTSNLIYSAPSAGTFVIYVATDATTPVDSGRYTIEVLPECGCFQFGDLDCDCKVDLSDLQFMLFNFGMGC